MRDHCGLCRSSCWHDWNWRPKGLCCCGVRNMTPHPLHDDGYGNLYALDQVLCGIDPEPGRGRPSSTRYEFCHD